MAELYQSKNAQQLNEEFLAQHSRSFPHLLEGVCVAPQLFSCSLSTFLDLVYSCLKLPACLSMLLYLAFIRVPHDVLPGHIHTEASSSDGDITKQ